MSYMKDLDIRIRQGGDDAIAAACELSGLAKERRGYEDTMNATGEITDIVIVLRGVGFAAVSAQAGDSASLLHYCVTHAADEIERLRLAIRRLADQDATLSICNGNVTVTIDATPDTHATPSEGSVQDRCTLTAEEREAIDGVAAFLFGLSDTSVQAGTGQILRERAAILRSMLERLTTH